MVKQYWNNTNNELRFLLFNRLPIHHSGYSPMVATNHQDPDQKYE